MNLLKHKKFQAAFVSSLVLFLGMFMPGIASGDIWGALASVDWALIAAPIIVAIGAQGVADIGKEKAKEEAKNGNSPDSNE